VSKIVIRAEHFRELVDTFQLTTKLTAVEVANILGVSKTTLYRWKREGVPHEGLINVRNTFAEYFKEGK